MAAPRFIDDYLSYLLARASYAVYKEFDAQVKKAGLSSLEWRVLATLADAEPMPVGRLALEVLAQQPTLTKSLDRLAAQGWVERQADPADARRTRIALTAAGRRKVAPLIAEADRHQRARLQALGVDDEGALRDALVALLRHVDEA